MKKALYLAAALTAIGILARLPHPARDIGKLKPIRAVWLSMENGALSIETDTGDSGTGRTLTEAYEDMRSKADGELFLDTAEFLILDPDVPIEPDIWDLLRPACKVVFSKEPPDLETISDHLAIHPTGKTLARLRATQIQNSDLSTQH